MKAANVSNGLPTTQHLIREQWISHLSYVLYCNLSPPLVDDSNILNLHPLLAFQFLPLSHPLPLSLLYSLLTHITNISFLYFPPSSPSNPLRSSTPLTGSVVHRFVVRRGHRCERSSVAQDPRKTSLRRRGLRVPPPPLARGSTPNPFAGLASSGSHRLWQLRLGVVSGVDVVSGVGGGNGVGGGSGMGVGMRVGKDILARVG